MPQVKLRILKAKRSTTRPIAEPTDRLVIPKPWWFSKQGNPDPPKWPYISQVSDFKINLPRNPWILLGILDTSLHIPRKGWIPIFAQKVQRGHQDVGRDWNTWKCAHFCGWCQGQEGLPDWDMGWKAFPKELCMSYPKDPDSSRKS